MQRTITGHTKFLSTLSPRQVRVIASDGSIDRMGDILEPRGAELDAFRKNPIVLGQHDAAMPIARCSSIGVDGGAVVAVIDFPPLGINERSDEYLALIKAGVLSAVSVGFLPIEREAIRSTGGWRYTAWELLELSCVSVPANENALVIERAYHGGIGQSLAEVSTLSFAGTYAQRKQQRDWTVNNSPEVKRHRRRAEEHRQWLLQNIGRNKQP
jgi:HK97 family phage prohead protease